MIIPGLPFLLYLYLNSLSQSRQTFLPKVGNFHAPGRAKCSDEEGMAAADNLNTCCCLVCAQWVFSPFCYSHHLHYINVNILSIINIKDLRKTLLQ